MWRELLSDPQVLRAYVVAKAGMLLLAGGATLVLARFVGPRVWYGYLAFVALMVLLTAVMLVLGLLARAGSRGESAAGVDLLPTDCSNEGSSEASSAGDIPGLGEMTEVVVPIEDAIDLHSFAPREIPDVVTEYLAAAHERGLQEVRLIHGRGIGVQRERVRSVLSSHPLVLEYSDAPVDRGGWGATVVRLRS